MISELELSRAAERFLGIDVRPTARLEGGDEAFVLLAEADGGRLASPAWRTRAELEWAYGVSRQAQQRVPQVVAPARREGRTVSECEGRYVSVFPFAEGHTLDRDDPVLRSEAATILAAIHRALLDWRGGSRPPSGKRRPVPPPDPPDLHDPALDAWWLSVQDRAFIVSATHGDYYRRNLLCANRRIVGVIDWQDASVRPLAIELAGATFEMCRDDEHVLRLDRADEFVTSYRAAGGPVPEH